MPLADNREALVERLQERGNRYDDGALMDGELRNPDGQEAADLITSLLAQLDAAEKMAEATQAAFDDLSIGDETAAFIILRNALAAYRATTPEQS